MVCWSNAFLEPQYCLTARDRTFNSPVEQFSNKYDAVKWSACSRADRVPRQFLRWYQPETLTLKLVTYFLEWHVNYLVLGGHSFGRWILPHAEKTFNLCIKFSVYEIKRGVLCSSHSQNCNRKVLIWEVEGIPRVMSRIQLIITQYLEEILIGHPNPCVMSHEHLHDSPSTSAIIASYWLVSMVWVDELHA
jgi:hypothetical protein